MFDLKELLGDDFLSESEGGMGMGLLPNLDEDLAKLEANLSELGDFGFDFMGEMDDDDDEALRSIESGKFDIEEFLKDGADVDELLSGVCGTVFLSLCIKINSLSRVLLCSPVRAKSAAQPQRPRSPLLQLASGS